MKGLEKIRKERKLSRRELSILSGVSEKAIRGIEREWHEVGESKLSTLVALAKALKCKVSDFVDEETAKRL